jgi:hypothetical protein
MNSRALTISIAGIPVRFFIDRPSLITAISKRYQGYIHSAIKPAVTIGCACRHDGITGTAPDIHKTKQGWRLVRSDFDFLIRGSRGSGSVHASVYSFDAFLRVLYSLLILKKNGVLLHASAVTRKGRAWIFTGRSGAGKTTIARLAHPAPVLNDEIVALVPGNRGAVPQVFGTPFWGEMGSGPPFSRSYPLAAVLLLFKSKKTSCRNIDGGAAVARLLKTVCLFGSEKELAVRALRVCDRLVKRGMVKKLLFEKSALRWEKIEGAEKGVQ